MLNIEDERPLYTLTVGEYRQLMSEILTLHQSGGNDGQKDLNKYDYGLSGIARTFGCSRSTANRIKQSGAIKKALTQTGRKIVIDVEMALKLYGAKY
ncbi:DUF3853 family protein [bacterium]|jgi:hypothetical protein|nr:DUF3853 family protein [bacterium]